MDRMESEKREGGDRGQGGITKQRNANHIESVRPTKTSDGLPSQEAMSPNENFSRTPQGSVYMYLMISAHSVASVSLTAISVLATPPEFSAFWKNQASIPIPGIVSYAHTHCAQPSRCASHSTPNSVILQSSIASPYPFLRQRMKSSVQYNNMYIRIVLHKE